jgi:hypothetical protein
MKIAVAIGILACASLAVPAGEGKPNGGEDDGVYVYTNADLETLDPIPTQPATPPTAAEIEAGWAFVDSVIEDAYARIDARRRHELARLQTETEAEAVERIASRPQYTLPWSYYGWLPEERGYAPLGEYGERRERFDRRALSLLWEPPNARLFRPITPIHARPYQTNVFRARQALENGGPVAKPHGPRR